MIWDVCSVSAFISAFSFAAASTDSSLTKSCRFDSVHSLATSCSDSSDFSSTSSLHLFVCSASIASFCSSSLRREDRAVSRSASRASSSVVWPSWLACFCSSSQRKLCTVAAFSISFSLKAPLIIACISTSCCWLSMLAFIDASSLSAASADRSSIKLRSFDTSVSLVASDASSSVIWDVCSVSVCCSSLRKVCTVHSSCSADVVVASRVSRSMETVFS